jgi:hypothetical protein
MAVRAAIQPEAAANRESMTWLIAPIAALHIYGLKANQTGSAKPLAVQKAKGQAH